MTLNLGNPEVGGQLELPAVHLWLGLCFGARRDSAHENRHRAARPESLRESPHSPPHSVQVAVDNSRRGVHRSNAAPKANGSMGSRMRGMQDARNAVRKLFGNLGASPMQAAFS